MIDVTKGHAARTDNFLGFAERWAREGYVVALPTFPLSREGIGVQDLASQPGATHMGIFADEPGRLFNDAVIAFLDAQLKGDSAALDAFGDEVPISAGEWRVKPR